MRGIRLFLLMLVAFAVVLGACAPKQAPASAPVPVPAAPQVATAAPTVVTPAKSPEDVAWDKVLQAAKKEGKVVAYDYFLVGDVGLAVSSAFEKAYGIKMDIITGRSAEFLERLKTEKRMGRITGDMVSASVSLIANIRDAGLTESMQGMLPVLQEKDVWRVHPVSQDPSGHLLAFVYNSSSAYYNIKLLKSDEIPRSHQELLNPKWKGKIAAADPTLGSQAYNYFVPLINRGILDQAYLKALGDQKLAFSISSTEMSEKVARGELPLMLPTPEANVARVVMEGGPIQAFALDDIVLAYISPIAAVKDSPHPNATKLYLNWRLSQEGQEAFHKVAGLASVRKDVPDYRPPAMRSPGQRIIVTTEKDTEDATRLLREKAFVPLLKR